MSVTDKSAAICLKNIQIIPKSVKITATAIAAAQGSCCSGLSRKTKHHAEGGSAGEAPVKLGLLFGLFGFFGFLFAPFQDHLDVDIMPKHI